MFGTIFSVILVSVKHCRHDTGYHVCLIAFKLHQVVDDDRRNSIDFESLGTIHATVLPDHFQTSYVSC